jgi:hypothetical protein
MPDPKADERRNEIGNQHCANYGKQKDLPGMKCDKEGLNFLSHAEFSN